MPLFIRSRKGQERFMSARALGYDTVFNSRNIEDRWYLMRDHLLNLLIGDNLNLHVAPQYSLWYRAKTSIVSASASASTAGSRPSDAQRKESRYPTPVPEEVISELRTNKHQTETSRKARLAAVGITPEQFATAGTQPTRRSTMAQIADDNSSSSSHIDDIQENSLKNFLSDFPVGPKMGTGSAATEHVADAPSRTPDFSILHTVIVPDENAVLSGKVKVQELRIPVLVEVKPCIERNMVDEKKDARIRLIIQVAIRQALEQAAALFLGHPGAESFTSIAACGPYWSYAELCPSDIPPYIWMELNANSDYPYIPSLDSSPSTSQQLDVSRWSDITEIEDVDSNPRLEKLRSALAVFPAISDEKKPILA